MSGPELTATILIFAILFPAGVLYCLHRRQISPRPGAFHLLVAALGCSAGVASIVLVFAAQAARDLVFTERAIAADRLAAIAVETGATFAEKQAVRFAKPSAGTVEDWRAWQEDLRRYLTDEIYELDFSTMPDPHPEAWLRRESRDAGLIRREFAIPAADGSLIPAVLLAPAGVEHPVPGIVFVPGHVPGDGSGLAQLVLPGPSYQNSAARALALAGYATMTIELRGFGLRGPPNYPDHFAVAHNAILAGSFYKKLAFSDIKRAVDLLQSLPEVAPERLGMSGASLGAELTVEYSGLDPRIKAVSFHSHGGRTGPYDRQWQSGGQPLHYCHLVPGVLGMYQVEDPFLLLAPRPTQGVRGVEQPLGAEFVASLEALWSLMDRSTALDLRSEPGASAYKGHAYFVEPAIQFFDQNL